MLPSAESTTELTSAVFSCFAMLWKKSHKNIYITSSMIWYKGLQGVMLDFKKIGAVAENYEWLSSIPARLLRI